MQYLKEKWESLSKKKQFSLEIILGVLLSAAATFFFAQPKKPNSGFLDFNIISAVLIALALPNVIEFQTGAKLKTMRKTLMIGMTIGIVVFVVLSIVTKK